MSREEAINILGEVKELDDSLYQYNIKYLEALDKAITTLESVIALSADLKAIDRNSMREDALIGFNAAVALFNKHLGGVE